MTKPKNIEALDIDDADEDGFTDGAIDVGKPIMTFNFAPAPTPSSQPASAPIGKMSFINSQRGATPAVDGEEFTLVRSYKLRPSTMKKLNQLKAKHDHVNVYLNTIVDEAISFYYEHVFSRSTKS